MAPNTTTKFALHLASLVFLASGNGRPQRAANDTTPAAKASTDGQSPVSHELVESERIKFSAPPPTIVEAGVQCDANGNIYAPYAPSFGPATYTALMCGASFPISKLSLASKTVVQFLPGPFPGYAQSRSLSFYVDPNGKVYGLFFASKQGRDDKGPNWGERLVVKYKDDGTVDSVVKLEPPAGEHFQAWKFAALLDGNFLVTGTIMSEKQSATKPLTAIFDSGGNFVTPLTLPNDVGPSASEPPLPAVGSFPPPQAGDLGGAIQGNNRPKAIWPWDLALQQGLMAGSLDGNIYLLRASIPARLYAISMAGSVLRQLQFKPPEPGMYPIQMSLAGQNGLLLKFGRIRSKGSEPEFLTVLDLETGKITDTYHLPPKVGSLSACATLQNEFLFLGTSKDNHLEVDKYVAQ